MDRTKERKSETGLIRENQKFINVLNMVSDAFLIYISYFTAIFFRFEILNGRRGIRLTSLPFQLMAIGCSLLIVFIYFILQMYGSYRLKADPKEIFKILLVNGIVTLAVMSLLYLTRTTEFPRLVVFLFGLFSSLFVILKRTIGWAVMHHYRRLGYNLKHVAIVGNGHLALQYLHDIQNNAQMGIVVDGYISKVERPALGKCLGCYEDVGQILEQHEVDELILALEPHEIQFMKPVLAAADKEGVRLILIPFYNDYLPPHPSIDVIGQTKLVNMRSTPLDNLGWAIVKRVMDIIGALALIVLTSPIMLVTAIGVKLSGPGPVLFKQERIGKNKKPFTMLKFRSMNASGREQTAWSTDTDPRKTRFGSFIRKFSIDELPQFFNVLFGDMSLIGPRPEIPFYVQHFKEEIPLYLVRQQVRPGITGWAQIHGLRGDTSIEERVKYDIWYIENWSLSLDIRILFKTAFGGMINSEKLILKKEKRKVKL